MRLAIVMLSVAIVKAVLLLRENEVSFARKLIPISSHVGCQLSVAIVRRLLFIIFCFPPVCNHLSAKIKKFYVNRWNNCSRQTTKPLALYFRQLCYRCRYVCVLNGNKNNLKLHCVNTIYFSCCLPSNLNFSSISWISKWNGLGFLIDIFKNL